MGVGMCSFTYVMCSEVNEVIHFKNDDLEWLVNI